MEEIFQKSYAACLLNLPFHDLVIPLCFLEPLLALFCDGLELTQVYSTHNPDFLQIYRLLKFLLRSPVFQHLPFLRVSVTVFPSPLWHSNSSHSCPTHRSFHHHLCLGTALHLHRTNPAHQSLQSDLPPLQWIVYRHLFLATVLHLPRQLCLVLANANQCHQCMQFHLR